MQTLTFFSPNVPLQKFCRLFLLPLFLLCCVQIAQAQDQNSNASQDEIEANPNRPTVSNPADITQYGVLEIEYGVQANDDEQTLDALLKFSVLRDLEIRIGSTTLQHNSELNLTKVGDTQLGFQYRFLHQSKYKPSMAISYSVNVPTSGNVLGSDEYDQQITGLVSKNFGDYTVDFNLLVSLVNRLDKGGYDKVYSPALAVSRPLGSRFTIAGEIFADSRQNRFTPGNKSGLVALSYAVTPRLVFDVATSFRIVGDAPRATLLAGFTYSIADIYKAFRRRP